MSSSSICAVVKFIRECTRQLTDTCSARARHHPPPTPLTSLTSPLPLRLTCRFHFAKTPPIVVTASGMVVAASDDCYLVGLPSPDVAGETWAAYSFLRSDAADKTDRATCPDLVLDETDRVYLVQCLENKLTCNAYSWTTTGGRAAPLYWNPANLGGVMRIIELYNIGLMVANGKLFVPLGPDFTLFNDGLAIVDGTTGTVNLVNLGLTANAGVTGSARIPGTGGNPDTYGFVVSYDDGRSVNSTMVAFDASGNKQWVSAATSQSDVDQPHPVYDPIGQRLFTVEFRGGGIIPPVTIDCVNPRNGQPCAGWTAAGVTIVDNFDGYPLNWCFTGALLPNPSRSAVDRLLYTITAEPQGGNPAGCIFAVNPNNGAVIDLYCFPQPTDGSAAIQFLSTAPLIAWNARGTGAHTVFVGQFDFTVYALDPYNLAAGPLYVMNPMPAGDRATISADYLAMTPGGSLLIAGWRDDDQEYVIVAIPNALSAPVSPARSGDGLSAGANAAIALSVLGVAGAGAFLYFKKGVNFSTLAASAKAANPFGGGYSSIGKAGGSSASTPFSGASASASTYQSGGTSSSGYSNI